MDVKIEALKKTRIFLLNVIADLTLEQLNKIPEGFNNNIIWNLAHLLVVQQGLCYINSGLETIIDKEYAVNYRSSTKPNGDISLEEVNKIKELFLSVAAQFEIDYHNGLFLSYPTWNNRYDVEINNIDEAMTLVLFHEGIHLGYIMALKRVINL